MGVTYDITEGMVGGMWGLTEGMMEGMWDLTMGGIIDLAGVGTVPLPNLNVGEATLHTMRAGLTLPPALAKLRKLYVKFHLPVSDM